MCMIFLKSLIFRRFIRVTLHFENRSTSEYIVALGELRKFLKATLQLHYSPGINPHNNRKTCRVVKITVQDIRNKNLKPEGIYWWSTPGLTCNPCGAIIWSLPEEENSEQRILWKQPAPV